MKASSYYIPLMRTSNTLRDRVILITLLSVLALAIVSAFTFGRYSLPLSTIVEIFQQKVFGNPVDPALSQAETVLFVVRFPRILLSIMVGASLAASGAAYQGLFRNPMVSPDILGVTSGAAVGAALGLLLGLPTLAVHLLSFCCGIFAVLLVMS